MLRLVSPARPVPASCSELFAGQDAAWAGFLVAHLPPRFLWLQDHQSRRETGSAVFPLTHPQGLMLRLSHPRDILGAAEEALACRSLSAVVAEIHGNPKALDFTATRRLAVRVEASGVALWLVRHEAEPTASAIRDRWRVSALPSLPNPDDADAPGDQRWRVELFRSRDKRPGVWEVHHERTTDRLHFSAAVPDRADAPPPPRVVGG